MTDSEVKLKITTDATQAIAGMERFSASTKKMGSDMGGVADKIKRNWMEIAGAMAGAYGSVQAGRQVIDAALQMERINSTMQATMSTSSAAAREIQYLREEAQRLGLAFGDTALAYAKFSASTRNTTLEGEATRKVFTGVSEAITALKLPTETSNGIFLALSQMMSKTKMSAEELSNQLGERLPGAVQMTADAMRISTMELLKQMELGKVMSADVLPKLAEQLHKTYGKAALEAAKGGQAAINRFNNSLFESKAAIGGALMPVYVDILNFLKSVMPYVTAFVTGIKVLTVEWLGFMDKISRLRNLAPADVLFNKKAYQNYKSEVLQIDKNVLEQQDDIIKSMTPAVSSAKSPAELAAEDAKVKAIRDKEAKDRARATAVANALKVKEVKEKDTVSAINALADATARWQAKVADLNPYLDTQDKKLTDIQTDAEKLILSGANLETVYDGLSESRAFLQMAKDAKYASQAIEETNKYATEQQKIQLELQKIITDTAITSAQSRADMQTALIDLQVDKGAMSISEGIAARYQIEKQLLDVEAQRLRIYDDMGEGVTDETALNILRDTTDLENRRNTLANQHTIELEKNRRAIILQSSSVSGGLMVAYEDLYKSRITWSQAAYNFEMDTYRAMGDGFGDLFYDAITGDLKNMSDYWDSMWKSMAKSMSQQLGQMAAQWSSQQIGNLFGMNTGSTQNGAMNYNGVSGNGSAGGFNWGGLVSTAGSSVWDWVSGSDTGSNWGSLSDSVGTAWDWVAELFHSGGVVGQSNVPTRNVSSLMFANAPRLHDGLASDEFPAILQAGETVIPKGGSDATDEFLKTAKQFGGIVLDGGYSYADMMDNATNDFVGNVSAATTSFSSEVSTAGTGFAHSATSAIGSFALGTVGSMVGGPIGGLAGKAIGDWLGGWLGDKIGGWFGGGSGGNRMSGGPYGIGPSGNQGDEFGFYSPTGKTGEVDSGYYDGGSGYGGGTWAGGGYNDSGYSGGDYGGSYWHKGGVPMYDRARNMLPGERLAKITNTEGVFTQGQMKAIGSKLNERSQGPSIGEIHLHIGNEEFNGAMKVIADGVVVERNKRGVIPTSRVYNA